MTADARCHSTDESILAVPVDGKVTAQGYGEAGVVASYLRKFAVRMVAIPQTLPNGFPQVQANNRIDDWSMRISND